LQVEIEGQPEQPGGLQSKFEMGVAMLSQHLNELCNRLIRAGAIVLDSECFTHFVPVALVNRAQLNVLLVDVPADTQGGGHKTSG